MQDNQITDLYWQRDESAIQETDRKYGRYLYSIACNILLSREDSEESVNDTYLKAWNTIPPAKPERLSVFLSRITRRLSIDRYRAAHRQKRQASSYALSLSELEECIPEGDTTREGVDLRLLAGAISRYLRTIPAPARRVFIGRYYYMDSIREIAGWAGMSESKVKSMLYRTRNGLKSYLEKEEFAV